MSGGENLKAISVFEDRTINDIYDEIQKVYLSDDRPWIIGYSGGKDSTVALQLVWYAIKKLAPEKRKKKIFVISANTLVESPVLIERTTETMSMINKAAIEQSLPIMAEHVIPKTTNTFWVNVIGRGYPAPTKTFRWCTDRMKIRPADDFILNKVSKFGEVILILGVRKAESVTRAQVMSLHKINNTLLSKHSKYPQAFVYTPIENFTVDDVWTYLLQVKSPWGTNNRDLLSMYTGDKSGECPLVIDKSTSTCGNSRFGCWTCTLVSRDKTMENLIESSDPWMKPMLELRDELYLTTLPENKAECRELVGRNGYLRYKHDGDIARGPYKLKYLQYFLTKLLKAQKKIQEEENESFKLIHEKELHEIRRLWITERGDWEDTLPKIYKKVFGKDLNWKIDDTKVFSTNEENLLQKLCQENDISKPLVKQLLDVEREYSFMTRRSGIFKKLEAVFNREWRTEEEILEKVEIKNEN